MTRGRRIPLPMPGQDLIEFVARYGYREAALRLGVGLGTIAKWVHDAGGRDEVSNARHGRREGSVPMAGAEAVAAAQYALESASGPYREALQARVDHPEDTLAGLAARLGWKTNTYTTRLRRALAATQGATR